MEYGVYVKLNSLSHVVAIGSDAFITPTSEWTKIDSGKGDKYKHAQGNYLPKPVRNFRMECQYMFVDGKIVERAI